MNICRTCAKIYMRECPLNKYGPNNMIQCSAYKIGRDSRILLLEIETGLLNNKIGGLKSRIDYLEDKLKFHSNRMKDLGIANTAKILNQNKIVADYAELLEQIKAVRTQDDIIVTRGLLHQKILGKFMKIFTKPLDDAYKWGETYRKVEKLIRELNR